MGGTPVTPMSLSTNPSLLAYASKPAVPPAIPREAPPEPTDGVSISKNGETAARLLESPAVDKILNEGLKKGDSVTIRGGKGEQVIVSKKGPSTFDTVKQAAGDLLHATAAEASNIVAQDPAFAFKTAAFAVQTQVFAGVPDVFTSAAGQAFVPMVRVVSIALDVKKATDTWKAEQATRMDRTVVGGHLVTDIAGIGGAVAMAVPAIAPAVGLTLSAIGLVGDIASYGYHVMKYFRDRPTQNLSLGHPPAPQAHQQAGTVKA